MQSIVIGNDTRATGVGAVAIGGDDSESYSRGQSYPVVGYMANGLDYRPTFSAGNGSTAISPHAQALTQGATAIGVGATAGKGTMSTVSRDPISGLNTAIWTADNTGAKEATAIGAMAAAAGLRSTAVGYDATASGTSSVAIGSEVDVTGSRSIVIGGKSATGEKAEAAKDDAIAIGAGTKAILEKSVALGSEAKTTRVLGSYGYVPNGKASSSNVDKELPTWKSTHAALAIGDDTGTSYDAATGTTTGKAAVTRQITGVAAGTRDTDAVNVAQLRATSQNYTSINSILPENRDNDGAKGQDSIAIGPKTGTTVDAIKSIAVGFSTKALGISSVAFGEEAKANNEGDVALGSGSETAEAVSTIEATVNGITYSGFAGIAPKSTVSVGKIGEERTITNVAAGRIKPTSTDAINGSQLYMVASTLTEQLYAQGEGIKNIIGGDTIYDPNTGAFTNNNIGGTGANNINDAIKSVKTAAVQSKTTVTQGDNIVVKESKNDDGSTNYKVSTSRNLTVDSITAGDTKVMDAGLSIKDGPSITKAGIDAGDKKVTNVANATISSDSKDAVNGSQLYAQGEGIKNIIGGDTIYDPNTGAFTNNNIGGTGANNINDAIKSVKTAAVQSKTTVTQGDNIVVKESKNDDGSTNYKVSTSRNLTVDSITAGDTKVMDAGLSIKDGPSITKAGIDAGDKKVTNVANATISSDSKDAVNGSQLYATNQKVDENTVKINKGLDFTADDNAKHHSQLGDTVAVNGDDNITTSVTNKGVKVALNKDVKVNSVQAGNIHISNNEVTIGNGNNAVSLTENGLNNGGNRITNVANGENDSDAVNMGQLRSVNNTINKRVDDLGEQVHKNRKRSDAGIAGVAAMSTIPQVILPGKSSLGIGIASRHGQGAIAIGYSRASDNGKHIIKLSGSYDSQRNNTVAAGYMHQW